MPHFELSPVETRVLGCMLEKERTTPENYPLSLNAITMACNQSTNRDPVTNFDERSVDDALTSLRQEKLATMIHSSGARVQKYRHNLPDHYELQAKEVALLCVLLLRGPQTGGELRQRTERMFTFPGLEAVEQTLASLAGGDDPLVRLLPAKPGQKERRWVQLLSGEPSAELVESGGWQPVEATGPSRSSKIESLETEVLVLRGDVESLKTSLKTLQEEFAAFRKQFE